MSIQLKRIKEHEFVDYKAITLFDDKEYGRCYAALVGGKHEFKISWRSDLMTPIITQIDDSIYSIGIDQSFTVFDEQTGAIHKNLDLFSNFIFTELTENKIVVVCEIFIIVINKADYSTVDFMLSDMFEDIVFKHGDFLQVKSFDGRIYDIGDKTNVISQNP